MFWQYNESGEVSGIASKVDLNYFASGKKALDGLRLRPFSAADAQIA